MKTIAILLLCSILFFACELKKDSEKISMEVFINPDKITLNTGIEMKYIEKGQPKGMPLLFLHGYTDTGRSFEKVAEELLKIENDLRIIIPDLRGHGASSMPAPNNCATNPMQCFQMEDFAADILAMMEELEISKAIIIGHSMGSMVAQELALHHTNKVEKMVLLGTAAGFKNNPVVSDFLIDDLIEGIWKPLLEQNTNFQWPEDAYHLHPLDLGTEVCAFLKENWVTEFPAEKKFLAEIYEETIRIPIGTWLGAIKALETVNHEQDLENLRIPTLVLQAIQDGVFRYDKEQRTLKKILQKASAKGTPIAYKTYGKAPLSLSDDPQNDIGHNLHWGTPKAVAQDILAFLKTNKPRVEIPYLNPNDSSEILFTNSTLKQ